jgi:hypothetical protein
MKVKNGYSFKQQAMLMEVSNRKQCVFLFQTAASFFHTGPTSFTTSCLSRISLHMVLKSLTSAHVTEGGS